MHLELVLARDTMMLFSVIFALFTVFSIVSAILSVRGLRAKLFPFLVPFKDFISSFHDVLFV